MPLAEAAVEATSSSSTHASSNVATRRSGAGAVGCAHAALRGCEGAAARGLADSSSCWTAALQQVNTVTSKNFEQRGRGERLSAQAVGGGERLATTAAVALGVFGQPPG